MKKLLFSLCFVAAAALCGGCAPQTTPDPQVERVILMIGDGMGVPHVTDLILNSPEGSVNMERAHSVGLVKTHSANNRVTDSAAAGTALATGHKTNNSMLGVAPDGTPLTNLTELCRAGGIPTGLVATVSITHATPGAFYAHTNYRGNMSDIALQLLDANIDVFMGGGLKHFEAREDGINLRDSLLAKGFTVAYHVSETDTISTGKVGVFQAEDYLPYAANGRGDFLPKATGKTLEILGNNNDKFFAMIEGSLIDYAAHDNNIDGVRAEMADFDKAIGIAFDYADTHPGTLVIVLADHETGGLTIVPGVDNFEEADSGIEYKFSTGGHSASMIAMYAYGTCADKFTGVFDNTQIAPLIAKLLEL